LQQLIIYNHIHFFGVNVATAIMPVTNTQPITTRLALKLICP